MTFAEYRVHPSARGHHGHTTSIETARDQPYSTTSVAGFKRPAYNEPEPVEKHTRFLQTTSASRTLPDPPTYVETSSRNSRRSWPQPRLDAGKIVKVDDFDHVNHQTQSHIVPLPPIFSSTPGPSQNPLLTLRHPRYGLPEKLVDNFEALGVRAIYPWQSSCLLGQGLLSGVQNLVYTAPTGGGKSLVADVLLLKKVIENPGKKAILVLPYVALVQEKLQWLRRLVDGVLKQTDESSESLGFQQRPKSRAIRVAGFFGGSRFQVNWFDWDIAVCTIEKANALVNSAIENGKYGDIGAVGLDELHMLNDEHRGYIMELLATKLLALDAEVQIVGMSATLPNLQLVATWLKAKFYVAKYRPIPIEEHLVYENGIYPTANAKQFLLTASQLSAGMLTPSSNAKPCRKIGQSKSFELRNSVTNSVVALTIENAVAGHGTLVFCNSRAGVERMAVLISEAMPTSTWSDEAWSQRQDVLASLLALPDGFEEILGKTIPAGVGFHHAGLTTEERSIISNAHDSGTLKVIVATCSLAVGINLPARRVILNGARMGREMVGPAMLRQMKGRAGRKGKDEVGETYLCCEDYELQGVAALLEAEMPPVQSCLTSEKRGVTRALLEVIAIRMASSRDSLDDYVECSLLWHTVAPNLLGDIVGKAVDELIALELVQKAEYEHCLEPTKLGIAVVASGLSPEDGVFVYSDLQRAIESFVMDGDLHIIYLFTPVQTMGLAEISWVTFRNQLDLLDDSGLRAMRLIGVDPALVNRLVNSGGVLKENTPEEIRISRVYRRAYSAFQLRDLCNEMSVHRISKKYNVARGQVQTLSQTCHGFAAGMIKFCERMEWGMLGAVLEHMLDRLRAGARADLLEMAQVPFVKSRMARAFWENGFKTVAALSEADPAALVPVMMQAQGRRPYSDEEALENLKGKLLSKAEIIVRGATRIWERQQMAQWEEE
ncbi:hypothetical protein PV10_08751 [Exophiala mesophila]|uniref:DNA polymerase theta subunit n=1 Tax=Exophiala mesophila TaxID=212818 RepID=A0A0D1WJU9_EXOME|nr:uncharacterized protein PV10_08751 [Exophiala mesophila]KIV89160.1 hypothetical protein PV10_08751 [Exophiala mesophila]